MKNSNKSAGRMMSKFFTWVFLHVAAVVTFLFYYTATHGTTGDDIFDKFYNPFDNWLNLLVGFICLLYAIIRIRNDLTS